MVLTFWIRVEELSLNLSHLIPRECGLLNKRVETRIIGSLVRDLKSDVINSLYFIIGYTITLLFPLPSDNVSYTITFLV